MAFELNNLTPLYTCSAYVNMYVVLRLHSLGIISIRQLKSGRVGWGHRPKEPIRAGHPIVSPGMLRTNRKPSRLYQAISIPSSFVIFMIFLSPYIIIYLF